MHFLYILAYKRQETAKRLERDKCLNKKTKHGGDRLCKSKITVKTENKTKINYNKRKCQPKMMTFAATHLPQK